MTTVGVEEIEKMNPTELMRTQTLLLGEISQSLGELQDMQVAVVSDLGRLQDMISKPQSQVSDVSVVDINMRLLSMVWFMVKWVLASIPATVVLGACILGLVLALGTATGLMSALSRLF